jgi:hypothetical protein
MQNSTSGNTLVPQKTRSRKSVTPPKVKKIVVIVDSIDNPQNRRPCFWALPAWASWFRTNNASALFLSIADHLKRGENPAPKLFDRANCDIILISWDAINGDPVFGSDISLKFFKHYRPRFIKWINEGGIIVVEAQTADLRLVQKAYKTFAFLNEEMRPKFPLTVYASQAFGSKVYPNPKKLNHPLLAGWSRTLPLTDETKLHGGWGVSSNGAQPSVSPLQFSFLYDIGSLRTTLYRGWFTKFHRAWEPLLFADVKLHHPVLLWRPQYENGCIGACILSSMHLSNPDFVEGRVLLSNLLQLDTKGPQYFQEQQHKRRQLFQQLAIATGFGGLIALGIKLFDVAIWESLLSGFTSSVIAFVLGRYFSSR